MPSYWTCPDCGQPHPLEYRELPDEPTRCEACEVRAELAEVRADNEALRRTLHIFTAGRGAPGEADENYDGTRWTGGEEE